MRMCPDAEARERSREYLIHPLEATSDTCTLPARQRRWGLKTKELKKILFRLYRDAMVKRYARPAADTNIAESSALRPFEVLLSTTEYLLEYVAVMRSESADEYLQLVLAHGKRARPEVAHARTFICQRPIARRAHRYGCAAIKSDTGEKTSLDL